MESVRIISREVIEPSLGIDSSRRINSAYDKVMRFALYQKRILFYIPLEQASTYQALLKSLKNSLAQVLVSFYPLAGRLSSSGSQIDCSTLSVHFSEAATDAKLGDLARSGQLRPSGFCDKLCEMGSSPRWPWSPDLPLLFAQVTRFADGGISIGIAYSHQIIDGVSGWHFFNSWAEIAREGALKHPPVVSYSVEEQDMGEDEAFEVAATIGYRIKKKSAEPERLTELMEKYNSVKPLLETKLFGLDQEHVSELKSRCLEETGMRFSTYVVVCGYFWRQTTIARCLEAEKEAKIAVLFDSRGKFAKVPKFYLGNAIATAIVSAKVGDLTTKGVGFAASVLHNTIVNMDEKKNQAQLKFMDTVMETGFIAQMDVDPATFSMVVSSPRHPVFETDFGFGKPIAVTFGENDLSDGKIYLFPSATGNGVDVTVVLTPQALDRLDVKIL